MKKIYFLSLLLALALILGGCSPDEEKSSDAGSQTTASQPEQAQQAPADSAGQAVTAPESAETVEGVQEEPPASGDYAIQSDGIETVVAIVLAMAGPGPMAFGEIMEVEVTISSDEAAQQQPTPEDTFVTTSAGELTVYEIDETAKSRNYPFTPQVSRDEEAEGEEVSANFGVGVPTPESEAAAARPEPEAKPAAESAQKPAEKPAHDIGVGFGAPEVKKAEKPEAETAAPEKAVVKPEQKKQAAAVAPKPKPAATPAPKPAQKKAKPVVIGDIPVQPLSPGKPVSPEAAQVSRQFKDFAKYWVDKINSTYIHGIDNIEVINSGGTFIARYTELDKKSLSLLIKEKKYDHTPFVGLMKYSELQYESTGATPEEALGGSFEVARRLGITEIFRYSEGKWVE